ncbi:type II toxin-antitoxin system RelE/ParE family toxin [uncultured Capnocytophaga sp.]|mgnify:FL=1|uniref:type II toxin-antitoxin system RelE/ParE family toxin n=1 Tax=uncultured Capnocytophaga sp. TaxID=159273 RepID=UPI002597E672|nr:type II toxin-antitoxin system RelE/ParE family toxin [uncultured Capnocytophaga sp.]
MEINWTNEAIESFRDTLRYWSKRNCNNDYSNKIIDEVEKTKVFLKENPMLLSKFVEEVKLYKILIMKGKFALYYDFIEEENLIVIKFFRSTKQKPLE